MKEEGLEEDVGNEDIMRVPLYQGQKPVKELRYQKESKKILSSPDDVLLLNESVDVSSFSEYQPVFLKCPKFVGQASSLDCYWEYGLHNI